MGYFFTYRKVAGGYNRAEGISLLNSPGGQLNPFSVFIWQPAGKFTSNIKEFNPAYSTAGLGVTDHKKDRLQCVSDYPNQRWLQGYFRTVPKMEPQ